MQITVKEYLKNSLIALKVQLKKRDKWIKDWPSQCCVTASEIEWTSTTAKALLTCQADESLKPLKILFRTQVSLAILDLKVPISVQGLKNRNFWWK
ncbi:unnamed protein product [Rotaria magnacalcarata]|uniref:Uncharacterized protein n=1 Tax=Rotaria magnacalcarata TaxID=392030 RepID=A0A8S3JHE8_9BILA|nr:unnamed protein product [Rotaria magnacalcarata]